MGGTLKESKNFKTIQMTAEIHWKQFYGKSNKITKLWKATLEKQNTTGIKLKVRKGI